VLRARRFGWYCKLGRCLGSTSRHHWGLPPWTRRPLSGASRGDYSTNGEYRRGSVGGTPVGGYIDAHHDYPS